MKRHSISSIIAIIVTILIVFFIAILTCFKFNVFDAIMKDSSILAIIVTTLIVFFIVIFTCLKFKIFNNIIKNSNTLAITAIILIAFFIVILTCIKYDVFDIVMKNPSILTIIGMISIIFGIVTFACFKFKIFDVIIKSPSTSAVIAIILITFSIATLTCLKFKVSNIYIGESDNSANLVAGAVSLKIKTQVTGYSTEINNLVAGDKYSEVIQISGCFGRELELQLFQAGEWKTINRITLPNTKDASIQVTYPNEIWQTGQTKWRLFIDSNNKATQFVSPEINATSIRRFQNSGEWLQLSDTDVPYAGQRGRVIEPGFMGTRVVEIRKALGIQVYVGGEVYYSNDAVRRVKQIQQNNGMDPNGKVDLETWKLLGLNQDLFYDMDNDTHKLMANRSMTRDQLIETMISTAMEYQGKPFITGASGSNKYGVDCSGLISQALYGIGLNPLPSNTYRHVEPIYEYESRQLWYNNKIKHVNLNERRRGDLIFYQDGGGTVIHIAIYLGNDKILHSWPYKGVTVASMWIRPKIKGIGRPLV